MRQAQRPRSARVPRQRLPLPPVDLRLVLPVALRRQHSALRRPSVHRLVRLRRLRSVQVRRRRPRPSLSAAAAVAVELRLVADFSKSSRRSKTVAASPRLVVQEEDGEDVIRSPKLFV